MHYIIDSQHHELIGMISYNGAGWGGNFTKGNVVDLGEERVLIELEEKPDSLPDYFELSATPIVSRAFLDVFEKLPLDNYQIIPVTVITPNTEISGHYILNILGKVSCVNMAKSTLKMYKKRIMRIVDLSPDLESISGKNLFRIQEYPLAIVISEDVSEALRSNELTGINIMPLVGWSDRHRF